MNGLTDIDKNTLNQQKQKLFLTYIALKTIEYKGLSAFYFFSYIYSARLKSHVIVLCEEILLWHFSPSEISIQQVSDVSMQVPVHRSKHVLVDTLLTGACVFAKSTLFGSTLSKTAIGVYSILNRQSYVFFV